MKKQYHDERTGYTIVLMHCVCSVWPIVAGIQYGRCADCGVRPVSIPNWSST